MLRAIACIAAFVACDTNPVLVQDLFFEDNPKIKRRKLKAKEYEDCDFKRNRDEDIFDARSDGY